MLLTSINSISNTSWCPKGGKKLIALGTASGTLDASFDTNGELNFYQLGHYFEQPPVKLLKSLKSKCKFTSMSWGEGPNQYEYGLLATGLEGGCFNVWDPSKIIDQNSQNDAQIVDYNISNGDNQFSITSIEFSPTDLNMLALGVNNGVLMLWDLEYVNNKPSISQIETNTRLSTISWNKQVPNIIGISGSNGEVSIWDAKKQFKVMELKDPYTRPSLTYIMWDQTVATRIFTSSGDDNSPFIMSWDMRNPNYPEKVYKGHDKGVLSMAWCSHDQNLFVSSSKDARVLLWNAATCSVVGELIRSSNWVFKVTSSNIMPNLIASSSFDGLTNIHDILYISRENCEKYNASYYQDNIPIDFVPSWLTVPTGSTLTFGNKLLSFCKSSRDIKIEQISSDFSLDARINLLEKACKHEEKSYISQIISYNLEAAEKVENPLHRHLELCQWKIFEYAFTNDIASNVTKCLYSLQKFESNKSVLQKNVKFGPSPELLDRITSSSPDVHTSGNLISTIDELSAKNETFYSGIPDTEIISRAIHLGDIETAACAAVRANNFTDSLIIATLGGYDLVKMISKLCLEKRRDSNSPYMYVIECILENQLNKLFDSPYFDLCNAEYRIAIMSIIHRYSLKPEQSISLYKELSKKFLEVDLNSLQNSPENAGSTVDYTIILCYMMAMCERVFELWHIPILAHHDLVKNSTNKGSLCCEEALINLFQGFMEKFFVYNIIMGRVDSTSMSSKTKNMIQNVITKYVKYISNLGYFSFASTCLDKLSILLENGYSINKPEEAAQEKDKLSYSTFALSQNQMSQEDSISELKNMLNKALSFEATLNTNTTYNRSSFQANSYTTRQQPIYSTLNLQNSSYRNQYQPQSVLQPSPYKYDQLTDQNTFPKVGSYPVDRNKFSVPDIAFNSNLSNNYKQDPVRNSKQITGMSSSQPLNNVHKPYYIPNNASTMGTISQNQYQPRSSITLSTGPKPYYNYTSQKDTGGFIDPPQDIFTNLPPRNPTMSKQSIPDSSLNLKNTNSITNIMSENHNFHTDVNNMPPPMKDAQNSRLLQQNVSSRPSVLYNGTNVHINSPSPQRTNTMPYYNQPPPIFNAQEVPQRIPNLYNRPPPLSTSNPQAVRAGPKSPGTYDAFPRPQPPSTLGTYDAFPWPQPPPSTLGTYDAFPRQQPPSTPGTYDAFTRPQPPSAPGTYDAFPRPPSTYDNPLLKPNNIKTMNQYNPSSGPNTQSVSSQRPQYNNRP